MREPIISILLLLVWLISAAGAFSTFQPSIPHARKCLPVVVLVSTRIKQSEDTGDGGGGTEATSSSSSSSDVTKTLNLIRSGARILNELDSLQVDEESEVDNEVKRQEQRNIKRKQKKDSRQGDKNNNQTKEGNNNNKESTTTTFLNKNNNTNTTTSRNSTATATAKISEATEELSKQFQARLDAFDKRSRRTRIVLLKKVAYWAFAACATETTAGSSKTKNETKKKPPNKIDRNGFYSGILLVHLNLAKYVGVAACHPPTRDQIDELFELADQDRSGYLDCTEFTNAVVVACAPITSRIAVYWSLLAILPMLVARTMGALNAHVLIRHSHRLSASLYQNVVAVLEWSIEHALSVIFFSLFVPKLFGEMDNLVRQRARRRAQRRSKKKNGGADATTLWWLRPSLSSSSSPSQPGWNKNKGIDDDKSKKSSWIAKLDDWVYLGMTNRWSSGHSDQERNKGGMTNVADEGNTRKKNWNLRRILPW